MPKTTKKDSAGAPKRTSKASELTPVQPKATGVDAPGLHSLDAAGQIKLFGQAIELFHKREYSKAQALFERAAEGPMRDMAHSARSHVRMCQSRSAPAERVLESADDYYHYGLALLNQRRLAEAERHLARAAELAPEADYVHYAMALGRGLSGNIEGCAESLQRAIELNPASRNQARLDPDFQDLLRYPAVSAVLFPNRGVSS